MSRPRADYYDTPNILARLERHIVRIPFSGCWVWEGPTNGRGYGVVYAGGDRHEVVHRLMWKLLRGPIPESLIVRHICDVKCCANPEHLAIGTKLDNARDAIERGRYFNQGKTHCKHGHEFTLENTRISGSNNRRSCRECDRIHTKLRWGG